VQTGFQKLYTAEGERLTGIPWNTYPRPQMRREKWLCLNGEWSIREEGGKAGKILVPFCPESLLSKYDAAVRYGKMLSYEREFSVPADWAGQRVLLHFGAVSSHCEVFVNGRKVCVHGNGYLSFSADVTEALLTGDQTSDPAKPGANREDGALTHGHYSDPAKPGANARKKGEKTNADVERCHRLEVRVWNDLSNKTPYGKQKVKRGGMWYTPVSGIWQSVWLEPVPQTHISGLKIRGDVRGVTICVESGGKCAGILAGLPVESMLSGQAGVPGKGAQGFVTFEGKQYELQGCMVRIEPDDPRLWSPETPYLYNFSVTLGEDVVTSYFALRSLSVEEKNGKPRLCLNGKPYFFHGLLDQGYFSDGIYTPATPQLYEKDILAMKDLGFNMLRKHIKIEPEQFYYDCDRLGMVVFQDMVNNGNYHFLRDTVFPTFGICRENDHGKHRDPESRKAFIEGMKGTVAQLYNHPCICYWTIFNEGWGQFEADKAYDLLRSLDDTRFIDATSGWFHQKKSDVDSLHIYFQKLRLGKQRELPQVLSEFGGYVYKFAKHSYNLNKTYGYKIFYDKREYARAVRKLYLESLVPLAREGLCASVYTQVSDVEDETNGILTYDRKACKLTEEDLSGIEAALQHAVRE